MSCYIECTASLLPRPTHERDETLVFCRQTQISILAIPTYTFCRMDTAAQATSESTSNLIVTTYAFAPISLPTLITSIILSEPRVLLSSLCNGLDKIYHLFVFLGAVALSSFLCHCYWLRSLRVCCSCWPTLRYPGHTLASTMVKILQSLYKIFL